MSELEFIVSIIAMGAGSLVLIVGITSVTGLIKTWLRRGKKSDFSDEQLRKLAKAFTQHKKDMERRLQNLEAIIADDVQPSSEKTLGQSHQTIEVEEDEEENKTDADNNNLKNMLRE